MDVLSITVIGDLLFVSLCFQRNLTEYYNAVDTKNMMVIFARFVFSAIIVFPNFCGLQYLFCHFHLPLFSMIFERRILVTSRKLSRLTSCVHAAAALLFPLYW